MLHLIEDAVTGKVPLNKIPGGTAEGQVAVVLATGKLDPAIVPLGVVTDETDGKTYTLSTVNGVLKTTEVA